MRELSGDENEVGHWAFSLVERQGKTQVITALCEGEAIVILDWEDDCF